VKAALGTQVNNQKRSGKERLRGEYGYTRYMKQHNYQWAVIMLIVCLLTFTLGKTVFSDIEPIFMVVSALLILPFAQFLAKAISFSGYKRLSEEAFNRIATISDDFLVLGELPIIRGKRTYFFQSLVITSVGVYGLILEKNNPTQAKKIIESIIQPKGHHEPVKIYRNYDQFCIDLKTKIKSQVQGADESKMERLAEAIIIKVH